MKGILKNGYTLLDLDWALAEDGKVENIQEDDLITFKFGEEVEILKIINDKSYVSGVAYVILNRDNKSMTVSSIVVDLIDE
ncbi:hypothetical protein CON36_33060 [Bacillus cereus]|uniref:Uncharacterized protein n=2 Tax=Bacillus cereus group TaxID=86661 RepID=A0A9X6ZQC4_BACTU|nr:MULTISPECIES: hypothetical protein [Bacillus cereus group]PDZ94578.1 hypothetical protein CON36_33060 [Bacillus cereus]PFJ30240.1 hypothetical protein COJ15_31025 [Bacillus thuringiensis]